MISFKKINFVIEDVDKEKKYCKFVISPLFKNFGITLGNSLRRIMLNSLQGLAVFAVEIEGVAHEFTVVPNVVEEVTEIILNLRKVIFKNKIDFGEEVIKLKIDKKGPGDVLAKDIEKNPMIEIINPETKIATLTEKGHLKMSLYLRLGMGYETSEVNEMEHKLPNQNLIYVDSNYSSISKVSYNVENIHIKNNNDIFEKLILEVHTNGLFTPQEAVANAANILISHLEKFSNIEKELQKISFKENEIVVEKKYNEKESIAINDLDLSVRSTNCLIKANINTLDDLTKKTIPELKKIDNLGSKSLSEIIKKIKNISKNNEKNDLKKVDSKKKNKKKEEK